ncbi:MAG: hypothetical protein LUG47_02970, partial [Clostridiales bacterium]|nr:hypothetical protein [Clostridiales bacterium]
MTNAILKKALYNEMVRLRKESAACAVAGAGDRDGVNILGIQSLGVTYIKNDNNEQQMAAD